jgi:hypothetical protein
MTRPSERELRQTVESIGGSGEHTIQDYLWADLKAAHDGSLTPDERQLLDAPKTHLSTSAAAMVRTKAREKR